MPSRVAAPILRRLLKLPDDPRHLAFDSAIVHARHALGVAAAQLITWQTADDDADACTGRLVDPKTAETVHLRFEENEPGNGRLTVRVPCPTDPSCEHAYDLIETAADLLCALNGVPAPCGDLFCTVHDE